MFVLIRNNRINNVIYVVPRKIKQGLVVSESGRHAWLGLRHINYVVSKTLELL